MDFGNTLLQVYAIVTDWLSDLDSEDRKKIKYILYDDMCHLGPFSQNPAVLQMNPITRFFGTRHLAVDCLHFLNHKDKVKKIDLNKKLQQT
jgi:hypothetical protein